jgi:hypothetical protein
MKSITLERIPQKTIRAFIQEQMENSILHFSEVKSTYTKGEDLSQYLIHEEIFKIPHAPEKVWKHYMTANPNKVWNGKMLSFGLMISKQDNDIMYVGEEYSQAKVGQVFYIELNIFGLKKLAVSHEIISIEEDKNYFELSYVEGSKSMGKQRINFHRTGDGETRIVHTTYYRSDSNFRDRYIYPFFHTRAIGEYHENMINSIPE